MKCQKCGVEITEGKLYCPSCGQEILIVPEYEPEVEQKMNQAMNHILNDVFFQGKKSSPGGDDSENASHFHGIPPHDSKYLSPQKSSPGGDDSENASHFHGIPVLYRWIILLLAVSFVILLLAYGYMTYTADYQVLRGNYYFGQLDYEKAMKHYQRAGELEPEYAQIELYVAECFDALDRKAGYEASLTKVIQNPNATEEQLKVAYNGLVSLYLEKEEYQKIDSLLKNCNEETILNAYSKYRALPPEFSHDSGNYSSIIPLKINGGEKGSIYYTTDGSEPTVESIVFTTPIFLNKGDYTIKAIYVNEFGVVSEISTGIYSIRF